MKCKPTGPAIFGVTRVVCGTLLPPVKPASFARPEHLRRQQRRILREPVHDQRSKGLRLRRPPHAASRAPRRGVAVGDRGLSFDAPGGVGAMLRCLGIQISQYGKN
jgi:hypothetical protein